MFQILSLVLVLFTATCSFAATLVFRPIADAALRSDAGSTNFGSSTELLADYQVPRAMSLMKFNVQNVQAGYVQSAKLRIYVLSGTMGAVRILKCDSNWVESTVTWQSRPVIDQIHTLGDLDPHRIDQGWQEINLGFAVRSSGTFCFALDQTAINTFKIGSRESLYKPELVVQTSTSLVPLPQPVTYAQPPVGGSVVLSGYTPVQATSFGAKCDGKTDDSGALQKGINSLVSGQALILPNKSCVTSNSLYVLNKSNIAIIGYGMKYTILKSTNKYFTAVVVRDSKTILLRGFQNHSVNTTSRLNTYDSVKGFFAAGTSGLHMDGIKTLDAPGAGILFCHAVDSIVENSEVYHSFADAFHSTCGSRNVIYRNNRAINAGDDCFASIGYGAGVNYDMQFLNNYCYGNNREKNGNVSGGGSAVAIEGTIGAKVYNNYGELTGVAGLRISSLASWNMGLTSTVDVQYNTIKNVRTRTDIAHAAIEIFANSENVENVIVKNNTIIDPLTKTGIALHGAQGLVIDTAWIQNNKMQDSDGTYITDCVRVGLGTVNITVSGNTKNGASCN
jgi:hypothetical protein